MISFWALVETVVVWFEDVGSMRGRGICGGAKARVASMMQSRGLKELAYNWHDSFTFSISSALSKVALQCSGENAPNFTEFPDLQYVKFHS